MNTVKADIIARLKKEILPLQGFRKIPGNTATNILPAAIQQAFPNGEFAVGAVHEFLAPLTEDAAATCGFISGIIASLMKSSGACIWITSSKIIFPPALRSYGVVPEKIIFIHLKKEKEILWTMEEALKCKGLSAVVGEMHELNFTASRRLQLAVEESGVTGFVLRQQPRNLNTTACLTRWKISHLSSEFEDEMPGVGFPRWKVELLKVRNGQPGSWLVEFRSGQFQNIPKKAEIYQHQKRKTG